MSESRTLARERGIRASALRGKDGLYSEGGQVPMKRERTNTENIPTKSRRAIGKDGMQPVMPRLAAH